MIEHAETAFKLYCETLPTITCPIASDGSGATVNDAVDAEVDFEMLTLVVESSDDIARIDGDVGVVKRLSCTVSPFGETACSTLVFVTNDADFSVAVEVPRDDAASDDNDCGDDNAAIVEPCIDWLDELLLLSGVVVSFLYRAAATRRTSSSASPSAT